MQDVKQLTINAIRVLSAEAIQKANSGHPGLPLGAGLQKFPQSHQGHDHGGRLKVQVSTVGLHSLPVSPAHGLGHEKQHHGAVDHRGSRAHRDQRIHIGRTAQQRTNASTVVDSI